MRNLLNSTITQDTMDVITVALNYIDAEFDVPLAMAALT